MKSGRKLVFYILYKAILVQWVTSRKEQGLRSTAQISSFILNIVNKTVKTCPLKY